ncbi:hypothetical protein CHH91_04440 [Virgibacillus sp. 7505]|nr:hypothetical protein CHH91_04440 [Virgibacillus sp. 7505]
MQEDFNLLFQEHLKTMTRDNAFITTVYCIGINGNLDDLKSVIKDHKNIVMEEIFNGKSRTAI